MVLVLVYLGVYAAGLLLAQWFTSARRAMGQGLAVGLTSAVAGLTLWLLVGSGLTEPWIAIAMAGTIVVPSALLGLGLGLGGFLAFTKGDRDWRFYLSRLVTATPFAIGILTVFAS